MGAINEWGYGGLTFNPKGKFVVGLSESAGFVATVNCTYWCFASRRSEVGATSSLTQSPAGYSATHNSLIKYVGCIYCI